MKGNLEPRDAQILHTLSSDGQIDLELAISACVGTSRKHSPHGLANVSLDIIIYGPKNLSDELGDFFQVCNEYLQDPVGCSRNVRYCNPHRFSSLDEEAPLTFDFQTASSQAQLDDVPDENDLLESLNAPTDLPKMGTPLLLETPLLQ